MESRAASLRVALYSHDTVGIGHTRRNLRIAQAIRESLPQAAILMITGARISSAFPTPSGVDYLTLPSVGKAPDGEYRSRYLGVDVGQVLSIRSRAMKSALEAFDPDLLIVDKVPRGTRGELDDSLELLRQRGRARIVLGLRDVLDDAQTVRKDWDRDRGAAAVSDFYDEVWVYGDPTVFRHTPATGLPRSVIPKTRYTGYLGPETIAPPASESAPSGQRPYALCQLGGGEDGARLALAFARARRPMDMDGVVLTGPHLDADTRSRIASIADRDPGLRVVEFSTDPSSLVAGARCVVSMGGYNSVCELLAAEKRTLIVPRVHPRTEQLIRARRLAALGLLDCLHPDDLSPQAVEEWLASSASPRPLAQSIDMGGLERIRLFVRRILGQATQPRREPVPAADPNPASAPKGGFVSCA